MFTKEEQIVLKSIDEPYKWIGRNKKGALFLFEQEPEKNEHYGYFCIKGLYHDIDCFSNYFKKVTWENSPVCFRRPILDDVERKYLKEALRPFAKRIQYIAKVESYDVNNSYFLYVDLGLDDDMNFPNFNKKSNMYSGMKLDKDYTLDELGITYGD